MWQNESVICQKLQNHVCINEKQNLIKNCINSKNQYVVVFVLFAAPF